MQTRFRQYLNKLISLKFYYNDIRRKFAVVVFNKG